jgi:hypothetical protein
MFFLYSFFGASRNVSRYQVSQPCEPYIFFMCERADACGFIRAMESSGILRDHPHQDAAFIRTDRSHVFISCICAHSDLDFLSLATRDAREFFITLPAAHSAC